MERTQTDPNFTRSLEQIEGSALVAAGRTPIGRRCAALRSVPLGALTAGDLGALIGQRMSLELIVPRALDLLAKTPLVAGDDYPGDLLGAVLRIDGQFWLTHPRWHARAAAIADGVGSGPEEISLELSEFPRHLTA